jgi:hypothetical protein
LIDICVKGEKQLNMGCNAKMPIKQTSLNESAENIKETYENL